jgi:hypothetical protein
LDGTHSLTAQATDSADNTSAASSTLSIQIDTATPVAPTITGTSPTNDATPTLSGTAEAGAIVTVYDGTTALGQATANAGGTFSFIPGTLSEEGHLITATTTDSAGNTSAASDTLSLVVDLTPPAITLTGADVTVAHSGSYTDPGVTAQDTVDGSVTVNVSHAVDPSSIGTYTVSYSATDAAGNTGTASRTVTVTDQTPPVITVEGTATVTVEAATSYLDAGASVSDAVDGNLTGTMVTLNPINATTLNQPGTYTVSYTSTDTVGNTDTATRTVTVVDRTAPSITIANTAVTH